jgi:hypothetical protein
MRAAGTVDGTSAAEGRGPRVGVGIHPISRLVATLTSVENLSLSLSSCDSIRACIPLLPRRAPWTAEQLRALAAGKTLGKALPERVVEAEVEKPSEPKILKSRGTREAPPR